MKTVFHVVIAILAVLLIAGSFLPFVETYWWFVRLADFPRLQFLVALVVIGAALLLFIRRAPPVTRVLFAGVIAAIVADAIILWPYRPGGADFLKQCPAERRLGIMVANVLLGNRNAGPLLEMVRRQEPDLFLAMETDEWWSRALAPLARTMPHRMQKITGSYYGIQLYSRHPLVNPEILNLDNPQTPAVHAGVTLPTGETIAFVGLHPRPPLPFQSTLGRDAQLYAAALLVRDGERPAIVAGDFNAVPWETAVARMQRLGSLDDPRRGYGYVPTFSATSWWQSWPLDHVFHEPGFATMSLRRLGFFGSDHYPYIVRLCRVTQARDDTAPALREGDLRKAATVIEAAQRRSTSAPRNRSDHDGSEFAGRRSPAYPTTINSKAGAHSLRHATEAHAPQRFPQQLLAMPDPGFLHVRIGEMQKLMNGGAEVGFRALPRVNIDAELVLVGKPDRAMTAQGPFDNLHSPSHVNHLPAFARRLIQARMASRVTP